MKNGFLQLKYVISELHVNEKPINTIMITQPNDMIYICLHSIVVFLIDELEEQVVFLGGHPSMYWPPSKVCAVWCVQYSVPLLSGICYCGPSW
jgi:hypothetical protein